MQNKKILNILIFLLFFTIVWSISEPHNILLWIAETLPLFIGISIMVISYKSFPLTIFSYFVIFIGAILILIGAHYGYSYVPIGEWSKSIFELERNNYDKLGHFFQGFITAVVTKEIICRKKLLSSTRWINFFVLNISIALSAVWEIFEWFFVLIAVSVGVKKPAADFLGTQNYIWDTQSDMFLAAIGGIIAIFIFGKYHERKIKQLELQSE